MQKSRLRLSENFPLKITKAQSFSQTEIKLHPFWLAGDKGAKMTSHGEGRLVGGESTKQGYLPTPTLLSSGKTIFIAGDAWFLSGASLPGSFGRSLGAFCHCQYYWGPFGLGGLLHSWGNVPYQLGCSVLIGVSRKAPKTPPLMPHC